MALINCPECGKQISDRAISCPNCGFPLKQNDGQNNTVENSSEYTIVLHKLYRRTMLKAREAIINIFSASFDDADTIIKYTPYILVRSTTQEEANRIKSEFAKYGIEVSAIPFNPGKNDKEILAPFIPTGVHCPVCGSTNITSGARGVNWKWGLIGASKTVNRCANCGHTWEP